MKQGSQKIKSNFKINVAVQFLPEGNKKDVYEKVDRCIALIAASGLKHRVCPFETVIEGYWDEIMNLVKRMQEMIFQTGTLNLLINLKVQMCKNEDITIEDKTGKYDK